MGFSFAWLFPVFRTVIYDPELETKGGSVRRSKRVATRRRASVVPAPSSQIFDLKMGMIGDFERNYMTTELKRIRADLAGSVPWLPASSFVQRLVVKALSRGRFAILRAQGRLGLAWLPSLSLPLILQDTEWRTSSFGQEPADRAASAEHVRVGSWCDQSFARSSAPHGPAGLLAS